MLHGFPEIAYSWRKVTPAVAAAGFLRHPPDLRSYVLPLAGVPDYDTGLRLAFHPLERHARHARTGIRPRLYRRAENSHRTRFQGNYR